MRALPIAIAVAVLGAGTGAGCGYGLANRVRLPGGAEAAFVPPFENLSPEPQLGATLAAAVRDELARRGAAADAGARAVLEGDVRTGVPVPSSPNAQTYRVALEARARLKVAGALVAEHAVRRDVEYLAGADALESEARRATALRRVAADVARDLVRAFEQ